MRPVFLISLVLAAACGAPPALLPPPFGRETAPRLFFPTGMASTADGRLIVANGNFDHLFDASTMVALSPDYLSGFYARNLRCDQPIPGTFPAAYPPGCDDQVIPASAFTGIAMIGNYSGPLAYDATSQTAYTGSRDTGVLNAVTLGADGSLSCRGAPGQTDCRAGLIDLRTQAANDGPYGLALGVVRVPGATGDKPALFVSSVTPHVDQILSNVLYTSATVTALDAGNPSNILFSMLASSSTIANGIGVGPMVFDPVRRQLLMSGCYQRFASSGGDPGSGKCNGSQSNILRRLGVDAGAAAQVEVFTLSDQVTTQESDDLLLADPDPATGAARTLYATARVPDLLLELDLPLDPSLPPTLRHAVSLPGSPGVLFRVPRPGAPDLLVISMERLQAVVVYDTGLRQVVAQIDRIGDNPFAFAALPSPAGTQRIAASVFGSCRVALIDLPLDQPWNAALRGRVGTCPP